MLAALWQHHTLSSHVLALFATHIDVHPYSEGMSESTICTRPKKDQEKLGGRSVWSSFHYNIRHISHVANVASLLIGPQPYHTALSREVTLICKMRRALENRATFDMFVFPEDQDYDGYGGP